MDEGKEAVVQNQPCTKRGFTDEIVATCARYLVTEINTQRIIRKTGMYLFKHLYRPEVAEFHNLQFDMDSAEKEGCGKSFSPESVVCNKLRTNLVLCCLQFYVLVLSVLALCLA